MPVPSKCPNPNCSNHSSPTPNWRIHYGSYLTLAHRRVRRYRCSQCGATCSDQTESIHYFAKRRLPLRDVTACLLEGASLREIGRRYAVSPMAVQSAILRLGRQAMAAQTVVLSDLNERQSLVLDGLRSFVTSQDYPCDISTIVDREGETILTMTHSIFRRGGKKTKKQKRRLKAKNAVWTPERGKMKRDISLLVGELWNYARPHASRAITLDTDEQPLYRNVLSKEPVTRHFQLIGQFHHRRTPSTAVRTVDNPLFPANYVDRLIRHRLREHTRETIAFGRNAVLQMHRAWIFAWDHNCRREHRVRHPNDGVHASQGSVGSDTVTYVNRAFFTRRLAIHPGSVPQSIDEVWRGLIPTPPVRWRRGQKGRSFRVPQYALRDIEALHQQAA